MPAVKLVTAQMSSTRGVYPGSYGILEYNISVTFVLNGNIHSSWNKDFTIKKLANRRLHVATKTHDQQNENKAHQR